MNLVKNAIKFTEKGSISVKATYDENSELLNVSVEDTGHGICKQDISELFKKFGKLQRTAAINSAGIGLGLTIVKQIVESAGGKVSVYSEGLGKGSSFGFTLKLEQEEKEKNIDALKPRSKMPSSFFIIAEEPDSQVVDPYQNIPLKKVMEDDARSQD